MGTIPSRRKTTRAAVSGSHVRLTGGASLMLLMAGGAALAQTVSTDDAAVAAATESTSPAATDGPAAGTAVSQTVLVTARQRAENAQDVPISLSVLTGNTLDRTDSYTLADVQQQVPGFLSYDANPRNSSIGIRGMGVTSAQDGMDTSVGVYVDNVYLGRPGMALEDLIDVDRVEILRGPQGTLFGRNSAVGAVNITTNAPSFTPSATGEVSVGNYGFNQERVALTGPLVDGLAAFRVTGWNTYREGTIDNTRTGGTDNGVGRSGVRAQLLLTPGESVSVRLTSDYAIEDDSADTAVIATVLPASLGASIAREQAALAETGWTPVASSDTTAINSPQDIRTRQGGVSSQLDWQLGWGTVTSISAFRFWDFFPLQDSDSTPLDIFQVNAADTSDRQLTQEFRLTSKLGAFSWQTGAYFFYQDLVDDYILHQYGTQAGEFYTNYARLADPLAPAVDISPGAQYLDHVHSRADSAAVFAQANWRLTDALTLTGGLRYTFDRRTGTALSSTEGTVPASLAAPIDYHLEVDSHNLSSLGSLSYKLSDRGLLYASYSTGYEAAGLNLDSASVPAGGLVLRPETVQNYEAGIKQGLWDGRLTVGADTYWTDLQGLQANYYPPNGAKSYLTNVGNVRARGVELESTLAAGELQLRGSVALNEAVYTTYPNAPCPVGVTLKSCVLTGLPLYEAPRWVANGTAEYDFEVGERRQPYVLVQYAYTSSYFGTIDDSPYNEIASFGVANARLGVRTERYDLALWVKNAFNKSYYTTLALASINASWGVEGLPGDPRTYGITLRAYY
jgi:iron complex outermembrane recepter protein